MRRMTKEDFKNLKIGDLFIIKGNEENNNEIGMEAIYRFVGKKKYHNSEVISSKPSTTGNKFCNFVLTSHHIDDNIYVIPKEEYPEYYI